MSHAHHWLSHVLGLDDATGPWYLFWSGVFQGFVWVGGIFVWLRHTNCHTPGCMRLGRYDVPGTPYKHCRKHHPEVS